MKKGDFINILWPRFAGEIGEIFIPNQLRTRDWREEEENWHGVIVPYGTGTTFFWLREKDFEVLE
jgi:hypothetical protein